MNDRINQVISKSILSNKPCKKLLEHDGITTNNLLLRNPLSPVILNCKNVKGLKEINKEIGNSFNLIKNLDEYQYIICNYIPQLKDTNIFKIKFQKIRILISLYFEKLTTVILDKNMITSIIKDWNRIGNAILVETSELIFQFREYSNKDNDDLQLGKSNDLTIDLSIDHFKNFQFNEEEINEILFKIYSIKKDN